MPLARKTPWFALGGAAAQNLGAYQFANAPDAYRSLVNVADPGVRDATVGVAPTWGQSVGLLFNGTTQYLNTPIPSGWNSTRKQYDICLLARWSGATFPNVNHRAVGVHYDAVKGLGLGKYYVSATFQGAAAGGGTPLVGGVYAVNFDGSSYINGQYVWSCAAATNAWEGTSTNLTIGASSSGSGVDYFFNGYIQAVGVYTALSPAQINEISYAMIYAHTNPAWDAWAPMRRWWYKAPAAAGAAKMDTYFRRMRS